METFEWIILLLLGAALLAALARRLGVPYPTFLAIGGACLAFVPAAPAWTLDPHLALTLFVAPVLLDAAYDTSLRDLRDNWLPVGNLVIAAVGVTTVAVAVVAHLMVPAMPWAAAIALGAIVAPPDAAAATAVVRQVRLPHRLLKILEGESLLNDATALLIYRLAVLAMVSGGISVVGIAPAFLLTVVGSIVGGIAFGHLFQRANRLIDDAPTAIIVQFSATFGVWIVAEAIGLSGILTIVAYAMTVARTGGVFVPARMRVPVYAVWETAVFILNAFAFVLIGMQLRPLWERLDAGLRYEYGMTALAVLATTILARFAWVMTYNTAIRVKIARYGFRPPRPMARPTMRGGLMVSWAGMRGIVTLAAAFALPDRLADGSPFPYRDLILICAFCVVFGTLVIQGPTLKPLIGWLRLRDGDPVGQEVKWARTEAYRAALDAIADETSPLAGILRKEYRAVVELNETSPTEDDTDELPGNPIRRKAIAAARRKANELRLDGAIGDDAYHVLEAEFDWAELSAGAT
ncbi:Na+/H+ antiporter [Labrys monachus]|uniref:CPA1 family monovalent cation:H+ antiporter n=1 Tax=Labrys monachus TaxID=217067 RepID=A0ABU0FMY5_9HYPH|nr:Na+/H+ antiporter [Labrys monachus]MDQ0395977.1 CPA1 family monovalent cation:H+ antiporter [Labrys monachus]